MAYNPKFIGITPSNSVRIEDEEWENYRRLGIRTLRLHLQRSTFGSSDHPDFSGFDAIIERAEQEGIEVILLITYESYEGKTESIDLGWGPIIRFTNPMDMLPIVEKAICHFGHKNICGYEIWNEQNGMWNLTPAAYAELLCTIYEKCKYTEKWDEEATICFGGFDAVNVGFEGGVNGNARRWLIDFYETEAVKDFRRKYGRAPFDVFCHHPYNVIDVDEQGEMNYNDLPSALKGVVFDTLDQHGDQDIPLWITEYGYQMKDEDHNAAATRAAILEFARQARVDKLIWFTYTYHGDAEAGYSLIYGDGRKRKAFDAFSETVNDL